MIPFSCLLHGQNWEFGGSAGYGLYRDVNVTSSAINGKAGFEPGVAFGALLGDNISRHWGGEVRYTFRSDDLRVSSGSTKATAGGQSHAIHYDVLLHATSKESSVRPFLAAGAGVKVYRGTGAEPAFQPLSNLVVLTHTTEAQALISVGGGVKFSVSKRALFRLDFRDYLTPLPSDLLATPRGSKVSGWMNDFVFLVGISTVF
jgi:Outer membrane protein beta-barrel domain